LWTLETLMEMQIQVGGQVQYPTIKPPTKVQYANTQEVLLETLEKEKKINQMMIEVHSTAVKNNDPQVLEVILEVLQKSVETVRDVSQQITTLQRCDGKMGEFLFDRYLLKEMQIRRTKWESEKMRESTTTPCHQCLPTTIPVDWNTNLHQ